MNTLFMRHERQGLIYYTVPAFDKTRLVRHAFTGRLGGVSSGSFESLNMGLFTGDDPENVRENRRRAASALGIDPASIVCARQVHSDHVCAATVKDRGRGALDPHTAIPDTDALVTNEKGVALMALFADCVPVFFLDPIKKAIGLAHAGWKGTVARIAAKTAKVMQELYGCSAGDLLAAVGPSIGPCHYQVDEPVIAEVKKSFPENWTELLTDFSTDGRCRLNLWRANAAQLEEVGLLPENITVAGICTFCENDVLFSHRQKMAGRQAALIILEE